MLNLFAFYLGGKAVGANIEVHDVVFAVSDTLENCYPIIKEKWFGDKASVHIDNYICLTSCEGYKIEVVEKLENLEKEKLKLFYINFGGSEVNKFAEVHESGFFVSKDKSEAIKKAKQKLLLGKEDVHLDNLYEVDDILEIENVDNFILKVTQDSLPDPEIVACYIKLK